jgi:hypothetical protein
LKDDLRRKLDEAAQYFTTAIDGNFLLPSGTLLDLKKLSEIDDDDSFSQAIEKSGGKNRIASFASLVVKQYNAWKIQQKRIVLLQTYCEKVDNEILEKKLPSVVQSAVKNKEQRQVFKKCLERHRAVE